MPTEQQHQNERGNRGSDISKTLTVRSLTWVADWIDRKHTLVTAVATVVIALFTITLWRANSGLLKSANSDRVIAQETAAAARNSANAASEANKLNRDIFFSGQRPWITISPPVASSDLTLSADGARIGYNFTIENVGNSAAFDVVSESKALVLGPSVANLVDALKSSCDDVRRRVLAKLILQLAAAMFSFRANLSRWHEANFFPMWLRRRRQWGISLPQ